MPHAFAEIAFTPQVKAAQQRDGSRAGYARGFEVGTDPGGFDWNCPQHIPVRLDAADVQHALDQRDARIAELESRLNALSRHAES